jgi:hypothetical protein
MKLIASDLNGNYLQDILEQAPKEVEWVKAAVAYAHGTPKLIDFCIDRKLRLEFWGRLDETVPVSISILERFLKIGPNYTCKLVWQHYHPKIIRFGGYGAYIGSANLTNAAWFKNIECGIFMSEDELTETGFGPELDRIFEKIDDRSVSLTEELLGRLREFERNHHVANADLQKLKKDCLHDFEKSVGPLVPLKFEGLTVRDRKSAIQQSHEQFLTEWNDTLQQLRQIQEQVILDQNRPVWIAPTTAPGVQVDQFLHGFYYHSVMDGNRSQHEDFFVKHKSDPQAALTQAMGWWKSLPDAPGAERTMIEKSAPLLLASLGPSKVLKLTRDEWISVCERINAFWTAARQVPNAALSLPEKTKMNQVDRVKLVAGWIYDQESGNGSTILQVVSRVLYGGSLDMVSERLWEAVFTEDWHVPRFGLSCMGEMIGWAMPDRFPPRNGRTSKALRSLGFNVKVYSGS